MGLTFRFFLSVISYLCLLFRAVLHPFYLTTLATLKFHNLSRNVVLIVSTLSALACSTPCALWGIKITRLPSVVITESHLCVWLQRISLEIKFPSLVLRFWGSPLSLTLEVMNACSSLRAQLFSHVIVFFSVCCFSLPCGVPSLTMCVPSYPLIIVLACLVKFNFFCRSFNCLASVRITGSTNVVVMFCCEPDMCGLVVLLTSVSFSMGTSRIRREGLRRVGIGVIQNFSSSLTRTGDVEDGWGCNVHHMYWDSCLDSLAPTFLEARGFPILRCNNRQRGICLGKLTECFHLCHGFPQSSQSLRTSLVFVSWNPCLRYSSIWC